VARVSQLLTAASASELRELAPALRCLAVRTKAALLGTLTASRHCHPRAERGAEAEAEATRRAVAAVRELPGRRGE
jgi:hypothetical protein